MIAIILAGGSGTRLWPMSTPHNPKHLLSLTGEKSLLQNAYERAKITADEIYILTDHSHDSLIREQLPELDEDHIIVEPGRRGTASCIVLALSRISKNHDPKTEVAFFHADHHIINKKGFADSVKKAAKAATKHQSIALIGIKPTYPATGFGYIQQGKLLGGDIYQVDKFKEKPDHDLAKKYQESGEYLWNMGLFAAPINVFVAALAKYAPDRKEDFDDLCELETTESRNKRYMTMNEDPIDIVLIEKAKNVVVLPGEFDWMDIGSYKDLHDILPDIDSFKNSILGDQDMVYLEDSENATIVTHNKPVAVIGLKNIVVVDTDEGILVCDKDLAQKVKSAAKKFNKGGVMVNSESPKHK